MKAKFKIGDIVSVNDLYLQQGKALFHKELKHKKFQGKIAGVHENTYDEKDGFGEIWQNFYDFKNGLSICEIFLRLV